MMQALRLRTEADWDWVTFAVAYIDKASRGSDRDSSWRTLMCFKSDDHTDYESVDQSHNDSDASLI